MRESEEQKFVFAIVVRFENLKNFVVFQIYFKYMVKLRVEKASKV